MTEDDHPDDRVREPSLGAALCALPDGVLLALTHSLGGTLHVAALEAVAAAVGLDRRLTPAEAVEVVRAARGEVERRATQDAQEGGR